MNSGYSREQAELLVAQIREGLKPPLQLLMYGKLESKPEEYRKFSDRVTEMRFDDLEGVYKQFRRLKPRKRWAICIFDSGNKAVFLDTSIYEKAIGRKVAQ